MNPLARGNLLKSATDANGTGLAADARSLDAMRRAARDNPQAAIKQAARQFEALFMQMVLKSMRDATPKSGMLDSEAQETYAGMLDQQLATKIAGSGTGLADVIAKQLGRQMKGQAGAAAAGSSVSPASTPAAPGAATAPAQLSLPLTDAADAVGDPRSAALAQVNPYQASRYVALSVRNAYTAVRDAELARSGAADARAEYLNRSGATTPTIANSASAITQSTAGASPPAAVVATDGTTATAGDPSSLRNFIARHWDSAQIAARASGVPANFILGQAALESGWGRQEIRGNDGAPSHNLFGIKAGASWQGRTVDVVTTEHEGGTSAKKVEKFRSYNNYGEAFRDWAQLIGGNPRFANVVRAGADAAGFAGHMQGAGYATDPNYGAKLARVINTVRALVRPT